MNNINWEKRISEVLEQLKQININSAHLISAMSAALEEIKQSEQIKIGSNGEEGEESTK